MSDVWEPEQYWYLWNVILEIKELWKIGRSGNCNIQKLDTGINIGSEELERGKLKNWKVEKSNIGKM